MNKVGIKIAVIEAERFIARARALMENEDHRSTGEGDYLFGSKSTGSLRRASLDLTRALADMRKF